MKGPDAANKLPGVTPHTKVTQLREKTIVSIWQLLVPSEAFEARADQGLLADGGGVHQEPGEVEAPGGEKRRGTEQGTLQLKHKLKLIKN